eukprot:Nk52_evm65s151 gene=Nk52_evmTU65s151
MDKRGPSTSNSLGCDWLLGAQNYVTLSVSNNSTEEIDVTAIDHVGWELDMLNDVIRIPIKHRLDITSHQSGARYVWSTQTFTVKSSHFTFYGKMEMFSRRRGARNTFRVFQCKNEHLCENSRPVGNVLDAWPASHKSIFLTVKGTNKGLEFFSE